MVATKKNPDAPKQHAVQTSVWAIYARDLKGNGPSFDRVLTILGQKHGINDAGFERGKDDRGDDREGVLLVPLKRDEKGCFPVPKILKHAEFFLGVNVNLLDGAAWSVCDKTGKPMIREDANCFGTSEGEPVITVVVKPGPTHSHPRETSGAVKTYLKKKGKKTKPGPVHTHPEEVCVTVLKHLLIRVGDTAHILTTVIWTGELLKMLDKGKYNNLSTAVLCALWQIMPPASRKQRSSFKLSPILAVEPKRIKPLDDERRDYNSMRYWAAKARQARMKLNKKPDVEKVATRFEYWLGRIKNGQRILEEGEQARAVAAA